MLRCACLLPGRPFASGGRTACPPASLAKILGARGGRSNRLRRITARHIAGPLGSEAMMRAEPIPLPADRTSSILRTTPCSGGDEGTRTPDICFAKAALSQLSYIPVLSTQPPIPHEPSHISRWAPHSLRGLPDSRDPVTGALRLPGPGGCGPHPRWWAFQDSNLRPFPYQRNALTN